MIDVDFIAGSNSEPASTSSYDAITIRFKAAGEEQTVIVIDGGFSDVGNDVANHITEHYGTDRVDLMISTHPDRDHLNGLISAIQQLDVRELMIHQPDKYKDDLSEFTNLDNLNTLIAFAEDKGIPITDPFTEVSRFNDRILVLGPSEAYYKELLESQLDPAVKAVFANTGRTSQLSAVIENLFQRVLSHLPIETLNDDGITHPRNNSSVMVLLDFRGRKYMFTGDAGIPALEAAADEYEARFGSFEKVPLTFFQAPHHGSKRNVGKTILNRILGEPGSGFNDNYYAFIHAAKASFKHPSPKVTNALMRRGCKRTSLAVTNGQTKWHSRDSLPRDGWSSIAPYPILAED